MVSDKLPKQDGHPSTTNNGEWMITDTYPGLDRMSRIILFNMKHNTVIHIGRFYQPLSYRGCNRIDLHPKWNINGDTIYFESGHNGKRNLYSIYIHDSMTN